MNVLEGKSEEFKAGWLEGRMQIIKELEELIAIGGLNQLPAVIGGDKALEVDPTTRICPKSFTVYSIEKNS